MPNTKLKLKLRKNKKIKEVILKLGSFDDKIVATRSDLINNSLFLGQSNLD